MSSPYTPANNDTAIEMLREVFGDAITHIVGGSTTAAQASTANMLGTAFGFFNSGVLFFGTVLLLWVTIFGVTNTANDGQFLGKKWSSFYTPLRTLTASAMLIPSASGYSMVQMAILLIVTWSVGFASNMWGAVVDYVINTTVTNQAMNSVIDTHTFDQTALNVMRMKTCAYAVTNSINQAMPNNPISLRPVLVNQQSTSGDTTQYTTTIEYADPNLPGYENICGKLSFTTTFKKTDTNSQATTDVIGNLQGEIASLQEGIGNAKYQGILSLFNSSQLDAISNKILSTAETPNGTISAQDIQSLLDQARTAELSNIQPAVQAQLSGLNQSVAEKFKTGGWVMAGAMHRELARVDDAVRLALASDVKFTPGTNSIDGLLSNGDVAFAVNAGMTRYFALESAIVEKMGTLNKSYDPTSLPPLDTGFTLDDFKSGGTGIYSSIQHWFSAIPNSIVGGLTSYLGESGRDPVMQVKDLGDYMAGTGELIYSKTLIAKIAAVSIGKTLDDLSNQPVVGAVSALAVSIPASIKALIDEMMKLTSPFGFGVFTLMYGGYFLGIWLPMVPFFIYSLGVIGWLVQVVEALAAGALWMVMHLTPEGNDSFIGSQQQGYLLLMSLFARPALMVLGIVASIAIMTPAVRYINAGFMTAFSINQADSMTGLLSIAGYLVVYCTIMAGVFMLVFGLPQTLPDRILRWIGAGIGDLGEQSTAGRIENAASGHARTAATASAHKRAGAQSAENADKDRVIQSDIRDRLQAMANSGGGNDPVGVTKPTS